MANDIGKLKIGTALILALSLAIVLLAPSPVVPGVFHDARDGGVSLPGDALSAVPRYIVEEAGDLAGDLFKDNPEKERVFINQLLAVYLAASDKDFIIIFNPGGWGWASLQDSSGWESIFDGIEAELDEMGYSSLLLNYQRTSESAQGYLSELMANISLYPPKAGDLALRVDFLTRHLPNIKIILTGESNGTIICDKVMRYLKDNRQVYSIQTGPPFWYTTMTLARTLVMRSNGSVPDSFSQGNFFTIIRANLEALIGQAPASPGHIMLYVGSPGHEYGWQYYDVRSKITGFIKANFSPE